VAAVFITQQMLTAWTDQGKVRLDENTLHLLQEGRTVNLKPAVRFTKLIDAGEDPHKLVGKVKTTEQLHELGAEHYMDSVILGDVGYTVVEGFMGDLSPPPAGARKPELTPARIGAPAPVSMPNVVPPGVREAAAAAARPTSGPQSDLEKEAEELSRLFLTTVRDS
jgi:hypothetical protein